MCLLSSPRFLDLSDEKGFLCGKILGDLGADVLKLERPGGDPSRLRDPFYKGVRHPERSLYWFAYNSSKRGITLDIEKDKGRELFKKLVKNADGVIETFPPKYLDKLGLGYQDLKRINPHIILTSITPFGQTGPYRDYRGSDIVAMAMGGLMGITGDPDRPPLRLCLDQACCLPSNFAAASTLLAYHHCQLSGEGQHVDISLYECVARVNYRETVRLEYAGLILKRSGSVIVQGEFSSYNLWRCRDGYVTWFFIGGYAGARENRALVQWMDEEGMAGELTGMNWDEVDTTKLTLEQWTPCQEQIAQFFLTHTRQELMEGALQRRLRVFPLYDVGEAWKSEHLASRDIWMDVEHPELDATLTYPGRLFLSTESEAKVRRRAPLIGEHNTEVYVEELGLTTDKMDALKRAAII